MSILLSNMWKYSFHIIAYSALLYSSYSQAADLDPTLQLKLESGYYSQGFQTSTDPKDDLTYLYAPYVLFETSYEVYESWVLQLGYHTQFFTEDRRIQRVQGGLRYQLDFLHYIPWFGVLLTYDLMRSHWLKESMAEATNKQNSSNTMEDQIADHTQVITESLLGNPLQWGVELGLDRRLNQDHVISFTFRWLNVSGLSATPSIFSAGLSWSYRWVLFDPFTE